MINTMKEIRDIADCIPGYTVVYKINNGLERIYYSQNLPELTGHTPEEYKKIVNDDPFALVIPGDLNNIADKIVNASAAHEKIDLSYRLIHKSGELVWVRAHANYIGQLDGASIYLTSIFNVTDEWNSKNIILDSSDRGIVVFDKDTKIVLYGNTKFFEYAGKTREECIGHTCYDVVCGSGKWNENECICFKALGRTEPFLDYNPVTDSYYAITAIETQWGEHPAIIFYMSDITKETKKDKEIAEKNAQLQLMQEESIRSYRQQLDTIMENNTDVLSTCQLNLTKNTCIPGKYKNECMRVLQNEGTAEGYFRLGLKLMDADEVQQLTYYPDVNTLLEAFSKGIKTISQDAHFRVEEEREMYVRTTVNMAENPVTHDLEAVLFTRDLTQHKLQNDIMGRLMEKQYESISIINLLSNKVSVLEYTYDAVAGHKYQNAEYSSCMGFFVDTYVVPEDKEMYRNRAELSTIIKKLDEHDYYSFMFHFQSCNGEVRFKTIEYYYSDKRHTTIIGLTRDITEITEQQNKNLRSLKEALLQADKATEAKSAFFSNISHDMRTPLNGILGFANLGMEAKSIEEEKEYFSKIITSGEFLLQLINDTLDISKIESGRMKLNPKKENEFEIIQEVVCAVEENAHKKGIKFAVDCPYDDGKCIWTDKLRLQQVCTNLLGNAIKFTPEGGRVDFTVSRLEVPEKGCNHRIVVKDTGIGMKKEFIPHAFEAYSQQEGVPTEKAMGTGLGLAIVKQIVDMMNGYIELQSEEGKGTRYDILLPLEMTEGERRKTKSENDDVDLNGKHILLCEDHPINKELAFRLLERKGVKVTWAENGKKGVQLFEQSRVGEFDAILMDIRMPEMNGLEATAAIRNLERPDAATVPIIAMTANAYESDKEAAIRFGMNAHIAKPIDPQIMYKTIYNLTMYTSRVNKKKVLVVDDIEVNIAVIAASIENQYDIIEASDGAQALDMLKSETGIVAIITDIQMPNMNGEELIKAVRENHSYDKVAILANTQYGDASQEEKLLSMGADDFIYKPTMAPIVLARLNNVVAKYR